MAKRALASLAVAVGGTVLCLPSGLSAQTDVEVLGRRHGVRPPPGYYEQLRRDPKAFQFSDENGWMVRGRRTAASRNRARGTLAFAGALGPGGAAEHVVSGELRVAVFLVLYANSDSTQVATAAPPPSMEQRMFGTEPAPPYSVNSYYGEVSDGRFRVGGTVFDWTRVADADSVYEAGCNGLCSSANGPMTDLIEHVVQRHDSTFDFGQLDNDGADGIPNSGDDDGFVDAIVLFHPEVDGACGNANLWAHKWSYRARKGSDLATDDDAALGGKIRVRDYILQGGVGGDNGCSPGAPQAIGVVTHETGHLVGLPDLYDTGGQGEGIGWWGLMGSGNWRVPSSPAHFSAWSKAELGWITEALIQRDTILVIGPIGTTDTSYIVPVRNRDEYFILENRQQLGSDVFLAGTGLLIWHVDSVLLRQRRPFNSINAATPNALALEQADGRFDLQMKGNRGDPSDPFPGSRNNSQFGTATAPSSAAGNGAPSYVVIDSIVQQPGGVITLQVRFELPTLIRADRMQATFRLDSVEHTVFEERLIPGSEHLLEIDDVQVVDAGRRRYTWHSWSNGQARSHTFTASPEGDSIIAEVDAEYLLKVTQNGSGGSLSASLPVDLTTGELLAEGTAISVTATLDSAGTVFEGWTGDTTSGNLTLMLNMQQPFDLTATFAAPLTVTGTTPPEAVMGAFYSQQLGVSGGTGQFLWEVAGGTLPPGLRLNVDGTVTGIARVVGTSSFTARVRSGSQTREQDYAIAVVAPTLVTDNVVRHLVGVELILTPDEIRYLDLLGNQSGQFDLGDFLKWVETTGGSVSAAQMAAVLDAAAGPPASFDSSVGRRP